MKVLKATIIFAAGVSVGVVSSMTYFKKKYERYANDEIESVRRYYREVSEFAEDIYKKEKELESEYEYDEDRYKDIIRRVNYNSMAKEKIANETWRKEVSEIVEEKNTPKDDIPEEPFEITLEEFEEFDPYFEKVMLSCYEDDVLTDDRDEIVDDIDRTIGVKNFEKFLNDDMDSIYIRNPRLSIDYEIDRILASYKEVGGVM